MKRHCSVCTVIVFCLCSACIPTGRGIELISYPASSDRSEMARVHLYANFGDELRDWEDRVLEELQLRLLHRGMDVSKQFYSERAASTAEETAVKRQCSHYITVAYLGLGNQLKQGEVDIAASTGNETSTNKNVIASLESFGDARVFQVEVNELTGGETTFKAIVLVKEKLGKSDVSDQRTLQLLIDTIMQKLTADGIV